MGSGAQSSIFYSEAFFWSRCEKNPRGGGYDRVWCRALSDIDWHNRQRDVDKARKLRNKRPLNIAKRRDRER